MNEVEELIKLDIEGLPKLKPVLFDDLHQNALKNIYLELGSGPVLFLLSPTYAVINPSPTDVVNELITKRTDVLNFIRELIIRNLVVYSALLDVTVISSSRTTSWSWLGCANGIRPAAASRSNSTRTRRWKSRRTTRTRSTSDATLSTCSNSSESISA